MSKEVHTTQVTSGSLQCGIAGALFLGLGGAFLVRMGYDLGLNQSRKILKRHDKDVRRMYKREKQIYKEQRRKEQERGDKGRTRWFGVIPRPTSSREET